MLSITSPKTIDSFDLANFALCNEQRAEFAVFSCFFAAAQFKKHIRHTKNEHAKKERFKL